MIHDKEKAFIDRKRDINIAVLTAFLLLCVSSLHFFTPVHSVKYHDIYDRLYYVPIILSAFFFGLRGGAAVALISGILFYIHLVYQWRMHPMMEMLSRYLEIAMYFTVGAVTGLLSDLEKKQRRKTEEAYKELRDSFEKVEETARLAAIGVVAAGVAHEIRNPLGGVKGAMEVIAGDIDSANKNHRFVLIIEREIKRMEKIISDFLNFSRPQPPSLAPDNLNNLIRSVLDLCKKNINAKNIVLKLNFDESMPVSYMDSNQIRQVVLNLVLNSLDAMPEGGELSISSRAMPDKLEVAIYDTGGGIPADAVGKLFTPFFTTRAEGTGLGLAISRRIMEQNDGAVALSNRADRSGAVATVEIPLKERRAY